VPHGLAVLLSLVIFFGGLGAIAVVVADEVVELNEDEVFQAKLEEKIGEMGDGVARLLGVQIKELIVTPRMNVTLGNTSAAAAAVSHSCACIGSPCLRDCVHGASIGGAAPGSHRAG
jgi:hypothetical protein